jgi:anti-anti-sigma factor
MGIDKERAAEGWLVRLTGELGVAEAPPLRECLLSALEESAPEGHLRLDMAAVDSLDICCLQVLLAAWRAAERRGARLSVIQMSAACREAVELAALDSEQWPACLEEGKH